MKSKQFYFFLIGLILIGIGSVFFYRQREEQRVLEFEGYEISTIQSRVDDLYNEEKTDLSKQILEVELEELELIFEELDEKKLSRRSQDRIREMQLDFLVARSMWETEGELEEIFIETNVVDKDLSEEEIDALEGDVLAFENMPTYIDRNIERLAYARQQVVAINRATELVRGLFDEEENVLESVTREDVEETLELIKPILNDEIKEQLTEQIERVNLVLTEREEQLALEEALQQQQEEMQEGEEPEEELNEVEQPQNTAPSAPPMPTRPPVQDNSEEEAPREDVIEEPEVVEPEEPTEPENGEEEPPVEEDPEEEES